MAKETAESRKIISGEIEQRTGFGYRLLTIKSTSPGISLLLLSPITSKEGCSGTWKEEEKKRTLKKNI